MTSLSHDRTNDPAIIAGIAREVIRRLRQDAPPASACGGEKLVTIETLDRYAGSSEIFVTRRAVVTPAAREEAVRRGIQIRFIDGIETKNAIATTPAETPSQTNPLCSQLARRGITLPVGIDVVWVDQPAAEVYRRCSQNQRAVMITSLADVDRFAAELAPQAWVLDRHKLNLVAAVNVAARIARSAVKANTNQHHFVAAGER
ncbi:MAG: hypothetical protein KDB00_22170 [Planctomycetales bacterium]|nr:hypothetical protein [Planctomycetales bacterium]